MKKQLVASIAAGLLASSAPAQSLDQDAQCLVASSIFARTETDAAKRQIAMAVRYFYLGRLDSRGSGASLKAALDAQAKAVTAANVGPTMTSCARSMQSKETALRTLAGGAGK